MALEAKEGGISSKCPPFCQLEASRDSYPSRPTYFKVRELWYPQWRQPLLETAARGLEGNENFEFWNLNPSEVFSQAELAVLRSSSTNALARSLSTRLEQTLS